MHASLHRRLSSNVGTQVVLLADSSMQVQHYYITCKCVYLLSVLANLLSKSAGVARRLSQKSFAALALQLRPRAAKARPLRVPRTILRSLHRGPFVLPTLSLGVVCL